MSHGQPKRINLAAALLLSLIAPLGCGGGQERVPDGTPVILISVDTLRSDRLPAYGYEGVETPAIDRLRADSILYANAYSPVPLTLPSHATALTGLLPQQHGVRDNMGYRLSGESASYLPQVFQRLGYKTGATVSTFVLRGASGLAAGFDHYEDRIVLVDATDAGGAQRPGDETLARAVEWLRSVGDEPFFFFFHIYEPHTPHDPPEPFASRYALPYDGDVADADRIVGGFLAELKELGKYESSIIVFFSDHGEHLGEHGYYEHGPLLYREVLQVPLLLKLPGSRWSGETVKRPAQLLDIAPTLFDLLGIEVPVQLPGTSLVELRSPDAPTPMVYGETFYPRVHFGWSDLKSLIDYPYHLIQGPDPELYNLASDPGETTNILRQERQIFVRLRRQLEDYGGSWQPPGEEDPEIFRQLEALGYIGSGGVESDGPLADPKSRLHVLPLMSRAIAEFGDGNYSAAVASLQELLEEEPGMVDAWERLAFALLELGREDEAVATLKEALERSGGAPHVALFAAEGFLRAGRLDEAEAHAQIALSAHELARDILAQIAVKKGELNKAERLLAEAVAERGTRLGPLLTLAHLRLQQERLDETLALTQRIEVEFGDRVDREKLKGLYFIRGKAHALRGDVEEAEKAFLAEIELSPTDFPSYTNLAFLHALENRAAEAGATLRQMVETNPGPDAYVAAIRTLRAIGDPASAGTLLRWARQRWPENEELLGL